MQILASHRIQKTLSDIMRKYGPQVDFSPEVKDTSHELNRFFWLHASKDEYSSSGHHLYDALAIERQGQRAGRDYRICNLVLQGGGALGLAHAGFIAGLECAGVRFAGLAGASAGSILAMGIAAIRGHDLTSPTHQKLCEIIETIPMDHFIDGPRPIRKLIKSVLKKKPVYVPQNWAGLFFALERLRTNRGLNRGKVFETWLAQVLSDLEIRTIDDLNLALKSIWDTLVKDLPELAGDASCDDGGGEELLQLITTAMPPGLKLVFPKDLKYLSPQYASDSPARLVRTSMSIPAFFEPATMRTRKGAWGDYVDRALGPFVADRTRENLRDLDELVFLDGGMLSNLPSDAFRELKLPIPTIVVPLVKGAPSGGITRRRSLSSLVGDLAACADAMQRQRDREIWLQNEGLQRDFQSIQTNETNARKYNVQIAAIDTKDANWLNFVMSPAEKEDLFEAGLKRAEAFLRELSTTDRKAAA